MKIELYRLNYISASKILFYTKHNTMIHHNMAVTKILGSPIILKLIHLK